MANFYYVVFVFSSLYSTHIADGACENNSDRESDRCELILDIVTKQRETREKLDQCLQDLRIVNCDNLPVISGDTGSVSIIASSTHAHCTNVQKYRLNATEADYTNGNAGGWCVATPNLKKQDQYVQISLPRQHLIRGVITQGRNGPHRQWVTQYRVSYSNDCITFHRDKKDYAANWDVNTSVTNLFDNPVKARCIRINPVKYHGYMSMRFDVVGCQI